MNTSFSRQLFFFLVSFIIGFGGTYAALDMHSSAGKETKQGNKVADTTQSTNNTASSKQDDKFANVKAEGKIFIARGCIQCHSVEAYNINAGKIGPDLSIAYTDVPDKFGKTLPEFLKAPTSAVMSSVIKSKPLTDAELQAVVKALKDISK